ncbi:MAG: hypothetical protein NZZ41_07520, partial [Candidatus Dojkabacteria bacterium]|nr:hypothetical protein [Candidatus Dojkabacteria bacterium]
MEELTQQQKIQLRNIIDALERAYKTRGVIARPRGRPSKKVQHVGVKPSKVPKRLKLKKTKEVLDTIIPSKLKNLVNEYKNLMINRFKNNPKYGETKFIRNIKDLTQFYRRLPRKFEENFLNENILPSQILDKPIPAKLDFGIFEKEISKKLKHNRLSLKLDFEKIHEISIIKEENFIDICLNHTLKRLTEFLIVKVETGEFPLGFFMSLSFKCYLRTGNNELVEFHANSLTYKREEAYVSNKKEIRTVLKSLIDEAAIKIYNIEGSDSVTSIESIEEVYLNIFFRNKKDLINFTHEPVPVGMKWRELPEWIRESKSIVNIQNNDDSCFKWCVTRFYLKEVKNNYRVSKKLKEKAKEFNWFGLDKIETFNEENICKFEDFYNVRIIIFQIEDNPGYKIMHLRNDASKYTKIYLGHYIDHFFLINNIKGFIGSGVKLDRNYNNSFYICDSCYSYFTKKKSLERHSIKCKNMPPKYEYPRKNQYLEFTNYQNTLHYPAVCYADFEATTNEDNSQVPNSFAFFCPDFKYLVVEYSPNPEELFKKFWNVTKYVHDMLMEKYKENEHLSEKIDIQKIGECFCCSRLREDLVRHHDHFDGKFIGYVCDECNKKIKKPKKLRIFFHNLKGYDSHFIIKYGIKTF